MIMKTRQFTVLAVAGTLAALLAWASQGAAQDTKYEHTKYAPEEFDIRRDFEAFVVSFDDKDDDDGDKSPDLLRVPEWVAQEIKRFDGACVRTGNRPSWTTDRGLYASGVAPNDSSYAGSGFDRGHMAAKVLAARISLDADKKTHTVLNAVPQMPRFNSFIWQDLEARTGAWAQAYERIWVIQGPVFDTKRQSRPRWTRYLHWVGDTDKGERAVAVPDALFKIVVREDRSSDGAEPEVVALAFIYPQLGPWYHKAKSELPARSFRHDRFLTTIGEIEELTGLSFPKLKSLKEQLPQELWPVSEEQFIAPCDKE